MDYTDFSIDDLKQQFQIKDIRSSLFDNIPPIDVSSWLEQSLQRAKTLPIKSEKARSELIISPILLEMRVMNDNFFTIYSGDTLVADKKKGLTGECDFILAKETQSFTVNTPIICVVEAKKQDMESGIAQCAAQMLGAKIYNQKQKKAIDTIYGCVTTADVWRFLKLENDILYIDTQQYFIVNLPSILGTLQYIIDFYKQLLNEETKI